MMLGLLLFAPVAAEVTRRNQELNLIISNWKANVLWPGTARNLLEGEKLSGNSNCNRHLVQSKKKKKKKK
jgi:hypothetical protein